MVGVVGSLSFYVQGGGGVLPNSNPFGQTEKSGRRVQKMDIFLGCHKCMVPKARYYCKKSFLRFLGKTYEIKDLPENDLMFEALYSQSRGPMFKTTGWFQGSAFRLSEVDKVSNRNFRKFLVQQPPQSGSSLEIVESHP